MSTNKVYGDRPKHAGARRNWKPAGITPIQHIANGISEDFPIDQSQALLVRRVQSRGRRHGAGIWPLFRNANLLLAWRLSDRPGSFRRRAARFSQLPGQMQCRGHANTRSSATRGSRCATTFIPKTSPVSCTHSGEAPRVAEVYNLGGGKPIRARSSRHSDGDGCHRKDNVVRYVENNRIGDHICYYSDLAKCGRITPIGASPRHCR